MQGIQLHKSVQHCAIPAVISMNGPVLCNRQHL